MSTAIRRQTSQIQVAAISRMFSSSVIRELACHGSSPLLRKLIEESYLETSLQRSERISDMFDIAFSHLKRKCNRDEYVYKTAITNKILLGRHSLKTASLFTEFRVGNCKIDMVIFNGSSVAYEIKSERDRLDRLEMQVNFCQKVFERVFVVAGENHIRAVKTIVPSGVGILKLSKRFQLSTVRDAVGNFDNLDLEVMFASLRLSESKNILESFGLRLPEVPNTEMFVELQKRFKALNPKEAHDAMVEELKRSRSLGTMTTLVDQLPQSLIAAVFSTSLSQSDQNRLLRVLDKPVEETQYWV
jgi:hypothetical protein